MSVASACTAVRAVVLVLLVAPFLGGQVPDPFRGNVPATPKEVRIDSVLHLAARVAEDPSLDPAERRAWWTSAGLPLTRDDRIVAQVGHEPGTALLGAAWLAGFGAEITGRFAGDLEIAIDPTLLDDLAAALPAGVRLEHPGHFALDAIEGEGPAVTGSKPYRDLGLDGTGIKIAVIDGGYTGLGTAQAAGDAPVGPAVTLVDYTTDAVFASGSTHGTGCVESVYDHAPGATYRLYKVDTAVDLNTAVADAIANGVDIISHSISWFNQGWGDDSGPACAAANAAAAAGILFFTSAGNRARQHWQGAFADGDLDGLHEWGPGDEGLDILIPAGATANLYLSWAPGTGPKDYDLFLVDTAGTVLISSTSGPGSFEFVSWTNPGATSKAARVRAVKVSGAATELELFFTPGGVPFDLAEHRVEAGSTTSPSNATQPNVIAVGAVDQGSFQRSNYTSGIIEAYSSQGPSNGGAILPDVVSPTNIAGTVYLSFGGTSAATPNAAGFTAVLWSCDPSEPASDVIARVREWAGCQRDFGARGSDHVYGEGGLWLPPYLDCNSNSEADACDILTGASADVNCNGIVEDLLCDADERIFRVPPIVQPFDFYSGSAGIRVRPEISEGPGAFGWPNPWAGFSMGIGHSMNLLTPFEVLPSAELLLLGGGQGPDFFAPGLYPQGVTVGVVFDMAGQESLDFAKSKAVLDIGYTPNSQLLAGSATGFQGAVTFEDTIGNPAVMNALADMQGVSYLPAVQNGFVELFPKSYVRLHLPAVQVAIDGSALTPPEVRVVPMIQDEREGAAAPVIAWNLAIEHDSSVMEPTAVELPAILAGLNQGNGPTFSNLSIQTDRVVIQLQNNSPFTLTDPIPIAVIDYEVTPAAFAGTGDFWSNLDPAGVQPGPQALPNVVFANNTSARLDSEPGMVDFVRLEPKEFIRGDCNSSGSINISDPIFALEYLFIEGSSVPVCFDACDANDDGTFGIGDPIFVLGYLFYQGAPPSAPFPDCGTDPTAEAIECAESTNCP